MLWLLAVCALLAATAPAAAQTVDADALFEQGRALRAAHRDADALAVFERLHAVAPAPRALAQIALAEAALGRWVIAELHLDMVFRAPHDAWTAEHQDRLEAARELIRGHLGDLVIDCTTPGAELWIAGVRVATLPRAEPVRVVAGTVVLELRAPGHVTVNRVVVVPPRGLAREPVSLVALASQRVRDPSSRREPSLAPAWWTAAAAGVLVVGGAGSYLAGALEVAAYNSDPMCPGVQSAEQPPPCRARIDTAETLRTVAIASLAGGAVAGIVAVALAVLAPQRERGATLACGPGHGAVGAGCTVRF